MEPPSEPASHPQDKNEGLYSVTLEEALTLTGFGRGQRRAALTGGLCLTACGLQNSLSAYILPSVSCDMHVSSSSMGLFNAIFLAGGLCSGVLWGALVDSIGRWPVLLVGMSGDGLLTLASSLSQHFGLLLVFRFLNGFLVGGPAAVAFAYVSEFQPADKRRSVLCYVGFFWTLSWVILPGVAWVVIPLEWELSWGDWRFNSWRLLVALAALPSLLSALLIYHSPESPKYYASQERSEEALQVLGELYSANTNLPPSHYPVKSLERGEKCLYPKNQSKSIFAPLMTMLRQSKLLLVRPVLPVLLLASYLMFSNMFGYYGLGLWLPELVHRFEEHYAVSNTTVRVCELKTTTTSLTTADLPDCTVSSAVFTQSLAIGSMSLIGNLLSGLLSSAFARPVMPVSLMCTAGVSVLLMFFVTDAFENMVVSSVFQLSIGTANTVYNSIIVDMFPPEISGLAVVLLTMMGRLGAMVANIAVGQLLDVSCTVPLLLSANLILFGGLLSLLIPRKPYGEDDGQQENNTSVMKA